MRMQLHSLASLSGLGSGVAVSCGVGRRCGSHPMLLWLWHRLAAVALIQPLAWKPPYATGAALKDKRKEIKKRKKEKESKQASKAKQSFEIRLTESRKEQIILEMKSKQEGTQK